jgi:G3E family GTPase
MAEPIPDFTPVNLLTGFLGSGKTTLLQKLLRDPAFADCAVLINEFGEVGLDHHLLERIDDTMILLQSGCLCCTIRGELAAAIKELQSKRDRGVIPPFRRLVIESTGLADPFPILSTVHADPVLRHHFRLSNVITTIDAVNASAHLDQQEESVKQIAVSDRLILTKTDLADAATIARVLARIRAINPAAPLWRSAEQSPPAEALISFDNPLTAALRISAFDLDDSATGHRHADQQHRHHSPDRNRHDQTIQAFALTFEQPIDWTGFGLWLTMLLNRHGTNILRVKGILDIAGSDTPVAVHGVQHLVHPPVHMGAWPDIERRSRIVFIVRGLAPALIEQSLRAFVGLSDKTAVAA